jgi:hypothetical protein
MNKYKYLFINSQYCVYIISESKADEFSWIELVLIILETKD